MIAEGQDSTEDQDDTTEPETPEPNKVPRRRAEMERLEEADTRDAPEPGDER